MDRKFIENIKYKSFVENLKLKKYQHLKIELIGVKYWVRVRLLLNI